MTFETSTHIHVGGFFEVVEELDMEGRELFDIAENHVDALIEREIGREGK